MFITKTAACKMFFFVTDDETKQGGASKYAIIVVAISHFYLSNNFKMFSSKPNINITGKEAFRPRGISSKRHFIEAAFHQSISK